MADMFPFDVSGQISAALGNMLSNNPPKAEGGLAAPGVANTVPRQDHQHPRVTATASGTLNGSGEATIAFTKTFADKPAVVMTYIEAADGQPVVFKVKSWVQDGGGSYTGCVIKGYRSQTIPTNLAALLLGGVFNLFSGSANGIEYSLTAVTKSVAPP